jgi:CheY-like chemotaxis protein
MQPVQPKDNSKNKVRILVVEDVANVATVLKARLESYGYDVVDIANTGPKAIASTAKNHPDIILMDILLEGTMNGIEAAKVINRRSDIPVIYLSCLNDQEVLDRAIETNPYGFILKPYDNAELRFSIENALIKHRAMKASQQRIAELEEKVQPADKE